MVEKEMKLGHRALQAHMVSATLYTHCIYIYIYRVKAGGSPEANCILFVWIWKMLILHCVLQCFMLFSESVRSAKVSMSARINLTFVRAEK